MLAHCGRPRPSTWSRASSARSPNTRASPRPDWPSTRALPGPRLRAGTAVADRGEYPVEGAERFVAQGQLDRSECAVQLLARTRADDGRRDTLAREQPGQRDVRGVLSERLAQLLVRLDGLPVLLQRLGGPTAGGAGARPVAKLAQRSGEQPTVQRRPRDDADPVRDRRRKHFELDRPGHEVVDALLRHEAQEVPAVGRLLSGGEVPAGEVRRANVADLALRDEQ